MVVADELARRLKAAGPAHHAAFLATNGDDPEWPIWYADHLVDDLRQILDRPDLTRSQLIAGLVDADLAYQAEHPDQPWWTFYATLFTTRFGT